MTGNNSNRTRAGKSKRQCAHREVEVPSWKAAKHPSDRTLRTAIPLAGFTAL